jgi:hypothetical protein
VHQALSSYSLSSGLPWTRFRNRGTQGVPAFGFHYMNDLGIPTNLAIGLGANHRWMSEKLISVALNSASRG